MTNAAKAENSYINYTIKPPYVEIYYVEVKNPVIRFLFQFTTNMFDSEYHFYIPESTNVTNNFNVDLE